MLYKIHGLLLLCKGIFYVIEFFIKYLIAHIHTYLQVYVYIIKNYAA